MRYSKQYVESLHKTKPKGNFLSAQVCEYLSGPELGQSAVNC